MISKVEYIIEAFEQYAREKNGVEFLSVASAHTVSDRIFDAIKNSFGKKVEIETQVDSSLIGGVVVRSRDTIIDGSVKAQLLHLQKHLVT